MLRLFLLASLALPACGKPTTVAACPDSACRAELITAAWTRDPEAGVAALLEVVDVGERETLGLQLARENPEDAQAVCAVLQAEEARVWCFQLAQRPHLWKGQPRALSGGAGQGEGPPGNKVDEAAAEGLLAPYAVVPRDDLASSLAGVAADASLCADETDLQPCATEAALERAARPDPGAVVAACMVVAPGKWRDECMFRGGERFAEQPGVGAVEAFDICLAAGSLRHRCVGHVGMALARAVPAADNGHAGAWSAVAERGAGIGAWWVDKDPAMGAYAEDQYWALATWEAVSRSEGLNGNMLAALPAVAAPHARCALAMGLVRRDRGSQLGLGAWQEALDVVLATRTEEDTEPARRMVRLPGGMELWEHQEGDPVASISYLGQSRRQVAADPAADRTICLLEAMARGRAQGRGPMAEALEHPTAEVRQTAERIDRMLKARR